MTQDTLITFLVTELQAKELKAPEGSFYVMQRVDLEILKDKENCKTYGALMAIGMQRAVAAELKKEEPIILPPAFKDDEFPGL